MQPLSVTKRSSFIQVPLRYKTHIIDLIYVYLYQFFQGTIFVIIGLRIQVVKYKSYKTYFLYESYRDLRNKNHLHEKYVPFEFNSIFLFVDFFQICRLIPTYRSL